MGIYACNEEREVIQDVEAIAQAAVIDTEATVAGGVGVDFGA